MFDPESRRAWLPKLIVEGVLIVMSILLALAVNQWQDARKDRRLADQALASFRQELGRNRMYLRRILPYHEHIRDQFMALDSSGQVHSFDDLRKIQGFEGFRPAFLLETAWRSALATGALTHVDYPVVNALSTTYTLQERIEDMNRATLPTMMSGGALADANAATTARQAGLYLVDICGLEREVLRAYDEMLAILDHPERVGRR
ncbi:MAG TPA: hypothetical protein VF771_04200 [Longimicrobiaceae bacterium]